MRGELRASYTRRWPSELYGDTTKKAGRSKHDRHRVMPPLLRMPPMHLKSITIT